MKSRSFILPLLCAMFVGGCGIPDTATYVDPNREPVFGAKTGSDSRQPSVQFGADAVRRAAAITLFRSQMIAVRSLLERDAPLARTVFDDATSQTSTAFEPRWYAEDPRTYAEFRSHLDMVDSQLPASDANQKLAPEDSAAIERTLNTMIGQDLTRASELTVPVKARLDEGFRALIASEQALEAGYRYEASTDGGDEIELPESYATAYGFMIDLQSSGLTNVPANFRDRTRTSLEKYAAKWFEGPTPPQPAAPSTEVLEALGGLSDAIATSAGIDSTSALPLATAPDQLRLAQQEVEKAISASSQNKPDQVRLHLATAFNKHINTAASSIATVDPEQLAMIEHLVLVEGPASTTPQRIVAPGAEAPRATDEVLVELTTLLDDAISIVESELELQREDQL